MNDMIETSWNVVLHEFNGMNGTWMRCWDWSPENCSSSVIGRRREGQRDDGIFYKSQWQVATFSLSICGKWNRAVINCIVNDELYIDLWCKLSQISMFNCLDIAQLPDLSMNDYDQSMTTIMQTYFSQIFELVKDKRGFGWMKDHSLSCILLE